MIMLNSRQKGPIWRRFLQKNAKNRNKNVIIKKKSVTLQKKSLLKRNIYVSTVFI
jgi:hypothetical protein